MTHSDEAIVLRPQCVYTWRLQRVHRKRANGRKL